MDCIVRCRRLYSPLQQTVQSIIVDCNNLPFKKPWLTVKNSLLLQLAVCFSLSGHIEDLHPLEYVRAASGAYGSMFLDGPMDVKTACDAHSGEVKGISSPVVGHADLLIFPNIESGNTFYKTVSLFGDANMAGMLRGTIAPVVVPSRADSGNSKYYSLALACVAG